MIHLLSIQSICLAFWSPSPSEMMVVAVVALLLYGGKLPEVARSWGKSFAEFRRGLSGFQNELNDVIYSEPEQLGYDASLDDDIGRDDSRLAHGYEENDDEERDDFHQDSPEQVAHDECLQDDAGGQDEVASQDHVAADNADDLIDNEGIADEVIDENEQTVKGTSADTVVIEPHEPKK